VVRPGDAKGSGDGGRQQCDAKFPGESFHVCSLKSVGWLMHKPDRTSGRISVCGHDHFSHLAGR
jgi:hypothetical protein